MARRKTIGIKKALTSLLLDAMVEVGFRRRVSGGVRRAARERFRLSSPSATR